MTPNPDRSRALVAWTLWASMVAAVAVLQLEVGGGIPLGANAPGSVLQAPLLGVCALEALAVAVIRWALLPRRTDPAAIVILLVIGLALSESIAFLGMFLVARDQPQTRLALLLLALACALQMAPFYASPRRPPSNVLG
jgi:hypothetical protein